MKTIIIAEAGINHNGSLETAKKLIKVASKSKADFIKFQTFKASELVSKKLKKANYQIKNTSKAKETQYEMLKKLELSEMDHKILLKECKKNKIGFLSTPFDLKSLNLLLKFKLEYLKISSGDIDNYPLLKKVGKLNKKIFLSTGMSTIKDIEKAIKVLQEYGTNKNHIYILHCNTSYPTPFKDVNLNAIKTIKKYFKIKTGYSDHTTGIEVPIAAVAMGAEVIEKHFTLDKNSKGPDHIASLEPTELSEMVKSIRNIEKSFGKLEKLVSKSEKKNIIFAKKSIVAKSLIKKGEKFSSKNICVKRPGNGISPMEWEKVIGNKAKKKFEKDELIKL